MLSGTRFSLPSVARGGRWDSDTRSRQELDAIFRGDGPEVGAGAKLRGTVRTQRGRGLVDERLEHPTWGTDDQLPTGIRPQILDTVRLQ